MQGTFLCPSLLHAKFAQVAFLTVDLHVVEIEVQFLTFTMFFFTVEGM